MGPKVTDKPAADLLDQAQWTPLLKAAQRGRAAAAHELLKAGASVEFVAPGSKATPLILAATGGHAETLKHLLAFGAEIEARDSLQRTALIHAAAGGHTQAVKVLMDANADVNASDVQVGWRLTPCACVTAAACLTHCILLCFSLRALSAVPLPCCPSLSLAASRLPAFLPVPHGRSLTPPGGTFLHPAHCTDVSLSRGLSKS